MTIEERAANLSRDVYRAAIKHFEGAEHAEVIFGNGHHLAQKVAEQAMGLMLERSTAQRGPGPVDVDSNSALKQRIRDLELERDLAIDARDAARAETRSQRKIAEDLAAGKVTP